MSAGDGREAQETPARAAVRGLPDPKRIQWWARRISLALAAAGALYLYARFSIAKAPINVVTWPYQGAPLILDGWPSWGRAVEPGDLVYYQFPGEPTPRPVVVAGLAGQSVAVTGGRLRIGATEWPHGSGPALEGLAAVPADHLLLLNHDPQAAFPDGRLLGVQPADGVTARVIWYWPTEPPKKR